MAAQSFQGSIELIIGPMFSGKSTELIRKVQRHTIAQKKCIVVNYSKDNRYADGDCVSTHNRQTMKAIKSETIKAVLPMFKEYDVIAIDEGQFFTDIVETTEFLADIGKIVIVAALDATFQRKPFRVTELIPIAEKVTKLTAVCAMCSNDAAFTIRLVESLAVELIGGDEAYKPVCRKCYLQHTKSKTDNSRDITALKSLIESVQV